MIEFTLEPALLEIYEQLIQHGYEAYFVGGCVRDALMKQVPLDYDITTSSLPKQAMCCFDNRFKIIPTGLKHGTITVHYQHHAVEITTFRAQEVYANHRSPASLNFTRSLSEDLKRRDFTINAMAYAPETGLIDEHHGFEDLKAGLIRCVGDPITRFQEDALRILRCVRFAHRFNFAIENKTHQALIAQRSDLHYISIERITSEFFSMLTDGNPDLLKMLISLQLLEELLPEMNGLNDDELNLINTQLNTLPNSLPLKLAALLSPINEAEAILMRWKVSRQLRDYVLMLLDALHTPIDSPYAFRKCLYDHHNNIAWMNDLLILRQAFFHEDHKAALTHLHQLNQNDLIDRQKLAVNGNDCQQFGLQGKAIRECLDQLIDAVLSEEVKNNREDLIKYIEIIKK